MKIVFFGSSDFATPALKRLVRHPFFRVVGVTTQPDRPSGRPPRLNPSPAKLAALGLHCTVFQPESLQTPTFLSQIKYLRPDFIVVAAYGKILKKEILDLPALGCFNIHGSLLPKYRGAAPIQRAIMDGCDETGVTIMKMDTGLDTGSIVLQQSTHIRSTDNFQTLHDRLAELGGELICQALVLVKNGEAKFHPQNGNEAGYAQKITRDDELIQWENTKRTIWNQIRALYPGPGAFAYLELDGQVKMVKMLVADIERFVSGKPGEIIKLDKEGIHIAAPKGAVIIKELQLEGKKKMSAAEFLRGCPLKTGQCFRSKPAEKEHEAPPSG